MASDVLSTAGANSGWYIDNLAVNNLADCPQSEVAALDDAYVRGATPDQNFGADPDLQVKRTLNPGSGKGRRAFLKFDTANFANATRFFVRVFGATSDASVSNVPTAIFAVPDTSWQEETITWNNQPSVQSPNPLSTVIVTDTNERAYDFDVTAYVQAERACRAQRRRLRDSQSSANGKRQRLHTLQLEGSDDQ
jgi:hypothetical protein